MLDEGRPTGVALVSPGEARLLEWRSGTLRPLSRLEVEEVEAPHERAGQIGGGPPGQFHTPLLEHRQSRRRNRTQRFLDRVAQAAADTATGRRWDRVLISGGERWTGLVVAKLPAGLRERAIQDPRVLIGFDEGRLLPIVAERLHEDHMSREQQLLGQVRGAGSARAGALGLSEVVAALNENRVAHLVYDPEIRYTGSVGSDGTLIADGEVGAGEHPATGEPRLTERLVERALAGGARVSPVEGAAAGALADAGGIGALLRW